MSEREHKRLTEQELAVIEARCQAATPGPLGLAIVDPTREPGEWFREHLSYGTGDIWCVWCPMHPRTVGEAPRPEHAVILAITGNGPQSEANAEFIACAVRDVPRLVAEVRELATVRAELDTFRKTLADNERFCLEMAEVRDAAIERAEVAEALVGAFREAVGVDPACRKCEGSGGVWLGLASSCEHWEPCQCWYSRWCARGEQDKEAGSG